MELKGEDLSCCSNKIESLSLTKCPYDHWLTHKAYLSATPVTDISKSFTYKMAAKIKWHNIYMELNYVTVGLHIEHSVDDGATLVVFSEKNIHVQCKSLFFINPRNFRCTQLSWPCRLFCMKYIYKPVQLYSNAQIARCGGIVSDLVTAFVDLLLSLSVKNLRIRYDTRRYFKALLQLRFEHDSSTIRARFELDTSTTRYSTLRGFSCARIRDRFEHSTRISGRRVLHVDWQLNAHNFYFILI